MGIARFPAWPTFVKGRVVSFADSAYNLNLNLNLCSEKAICSAPLGFGGPGRCSHVRQQIIMLDAPVRPHVSEKSQVSLYTTPLCAHMIVHQQMWLLTHLQLLSC